MKSKKIIFIILMFNFFAAIFGNSQESKKLYNKTEIETELNYPFNFNISIYHFLRFYKKNSDSKYTEVEFKAVLKPANILGGLHLKIAYLPFINFFGGTAIGTGWAYPALNFYGLAENQNVNSLQFIKPLYFSKFLIDLNVGIEFYFDLSSKIKSKWSGLILKTGHLINYRTLVPSKNNDFWIFDNDEGKNRNGAIYKGYYCIEYNMPLYLRTINIEFLTLKKLYKPIPNTRNKEEIFWIFGLKNTLFFKPTEKIKIKIQAVWKTDPIYYNFSKKTHFTDRRIIPKKKISLFFDCISASLIFKL